ncbi:MAG: response regulator [Bdellovibrionaceae bacterium]|nr:response regulator [Pseudobdellovibrionaceae bacterium]
MKSPIDFHILAEAVPNLVWTTDADGTIDYINKQCLEYSGSKSTEDGIEHWLNSLHEDDRPDSYAKWAYSLRTSSVFEKEYRLKRHDGAYQWFLGRAVPIRDEHGKIQRWIGTATNIEKQKKLLSDLQQSRDKLEIILEGITDGVSVFDREGRFIYANQVGARMCGFKSVEEMLATPTSAVMDKYIILDENGQVFPNEKLPGRLALKGIKNPPETILQIEMKNTGKRSWAIVNSAPIFDDHGEVLYAVSIFRDFTIHKENENSLKNRESTFRLIADAGVILNSSMDYLVTLKKLCELIVPILADWCVIDIISENSEPQMIVWHWNPEMREWAAEKQKKYRPDWRSDLGVSRVINTGTAERIEVITDEMLQASTENTDHLEDIKKLGMSSVMIVPILGNRTVVGAITFIASESKRKFSSFDLTLAEDLGRRAGLAIEKAILYESERKARELAENANNSKSTFLANMSHEIRTPLNALIGFNELLRSNSLTKEDREEYHNIIQRNGDLLLHLIDDILDLSKVEAGHLNLETVTISLPDLLNDIKSFKTAKASAKGLQFIMDIIGEIPPLFVTDPLRLKQILNNIIGNAIKFTSTGYVKTTVQMNPLTNRLVFVVSDTGIGIQASDREKLFQPFSQADASVTRKFGGTGLGLILSKRLAQRLGGDLTLKIPSDSVGATFVIEIAADLKPNSTIETPVLVPERSIENRRILVVDDSGDNILLIEHILKSRGVIVDTAENGQIGINKALANDYDIILMDIQMPVLDGLSAIRILREKKYSRPIIGLTAHAMQDDRARCMDAGCTDYLTKPIHIDLLMRVLSRHIND